MFRLVVLYWNGLTWVEYMRRGGLRSMDVADRLGGEELSRIVWRTPWRRVCWRVEKE